MTRVGPIIVWPIIVRPIIIRPSTVGVRQGRGWRVLVDRCRSVRESRRSPRFGFGDAGATERGGDFCLLAHFPSGGRRRLTGKVDDLGSARPLEKVLRPRRMPVIAIGVIALRMATRRKGTQGNARVFGESSGNKQRIRRLDGTFLDAHA